MARFVFSLDTDTNPIRCGQELSMRSHPTVRLVVTPVMFLASSSACFAASFVETLVCSNKDLSTLDEQRGLDNRLVVEAQVDDVSACRFMLGGLPPRHGLRI
jgi:hypothetical protein